MNLLMGASLLALAKSVYYMIMSLKQRKIEFEPRAKLNHDIHTKELGNSRKLCITVLNSPNTLSC